MAKRTCDAPSTLLTHHVFLDTEVYRQLGHNPENPMLRSLADHIEEDALILHIADITFEEISRQLYEFVGKTAQAMATAQRQLGRWRSRLPEIVRSDVPQFDASVVAEAAFAKLRDRILYEWSAVMHKATEVNASEVFRTYFARRPPFTAQDSKEFPDAFVVRELEDWCRANGEKMYVVTKDKAMTEAIRVSNALIPMAGLEDVLAAVAATERPDIREEVEDLLSNAMVLSAFRRALEETIDELIPIYAGGNLPDGEVTGHALRDEGLDIQEFKVVSASEEGFAVMLEVETPLMVTVDFEDRSSAFYDKEDDVYFGSEMGTVEFEADPVIRVFARIRRRPPGVTGLKILTGEIEVDDPYGGYDDYK